MREMKQLSPFLLYLIFQAAEKLHIIGVPISLKHTETNIPLMHLSFILTRRAI